MLWCECWMHLGTSVVGLVWSAVGIVGLHCLTRQVQCLGMKRNFLFWLRSFGQYALLASLFLTYLATCCRWIAGSCILLICLLGFGIWVSTWVCRKVCCWTLLCHYLYVGHNTWCSWSVIWCSLGCRLLLDLPPKLIHMNPFSSGSISLLYS